MPGAYLTINMTPCFPTIAGWPSGAHPRAYGGVGWHLPGRTQRVMVGSYGEHAVVRITETSSNMLAAWQMPGRRLNEATVWLAQEWVPDAMWSQLHGSGCGHGHGPE